jgi:dethiobiotin synthetase
MKNFFITGTDTDVGKTTIACALIQAFAARGFRAAPMKPISAGTIVTDNNGIEMNADVAALREVSASTAALSDINPYRFSEMMAPHLAAQRENVVVEMSVIRAAFDRLKAGADTVLVEGAGGFLVPLSMSQSMAEIPIALSLDVIVVVGMRLGVLNHALLTVEAIECGGVDRQYHRRRENDAGLRRKPRNARAHDRRATAGNRSLRCALQQRDRTRAPRGTAFAHGYLVALSKGK